MTVKEGGGRESGSLEGQKPSTAQPASGTPDEAAANPAAHRVVCVGHLCGEWHDVDPEALARALEAELAECGRSRHVLLAGSEAAESLYQKEKARVRDLERVYAENTDIKKLEQAEARVAELERAKEIAKEIARKNGPADAWIRFCDLTREREAGAK